MTKDKHIHKFFLCLPIMHLVVALHTQAVLPQSSTELLTSLFPPTSLTLHQPSRMASFLLRANHHIFPHIIVYLSVPGILPGCLDP